MTPTKTKTKNTTGFPQYNRFPTRKTRRFWEATASTRLTQPAFSCLGWREIGELHFHGRTELQRGEEKINKKILGGYHWSAKFGNYFLVRSIFP